MRAGVSAGSGRGSGMWGRVCGGLVSRAGCGEAICAGPDRTWPPGPGRGEVRACGQSCGRAGAKVGHARKVRGWTGELAVWSVTRSAAAYGLVGG